MFVPWPCSGAKAHYHYRLGFAGNSLRLLFKTPPLHTSSARERADAVGALSHMSESATKIKLFFVPLLLPTAKTDTLRETGAEDRHLRFSVKPQPRRFS